MDKTFFFGMISMYVGRTPFVSKKTWFEEKSQIHEIRIKKNNVTSPHNQSFEPEKWRKIKYVITD